MKIVRSLPKSITSGSFTTAARSESTYVYRAYCRCDDLLYVGITNDLFSRMTGHRRVKAEWELKLHRLEWDEYASRDDALRVEKHLIRTMKPTFNKTHAVPRSRPVPLSMPRKLTEDELDACAVAAYRGTSYIDWIFTRAA